MPFYSHTLDRKLRLSSAWTLPAKLFPLPLIVYGLFRLCLEFYGETLGLGKIAGFLFYSGVCLVAAYIFFPLKSVYLQKGSLRVSNYMKTVDIPLDTIKEVVDHTGLLTGTAPARIILVLLGPTVFGNKIAFLPRMSLVPTILDELQGHSSSRQEPPMSN